MIRTKRIEDAFKKHWAYILVIVLLCMAVYNLNLRFNEMPFLDPISYYYPRATMMKESYVKYGNFWPLWNPYIMSGEPFYARAPTFGMDTLYSVLVFLCPNIPMALNLDSLLTVMIAGIFMYFLVLYLTKEPRAGLVSALTFMFAGFIQRQMVGPGYGTLNSYFFMPLMFLFAIKALNTKKWVLYSIISGIFFALLLRGGPDLKVAPWTAIVLAALLCGHIIGKNMHKRAIKVFLIGLIIFSTMLALDAQKILPSMEFVKESSKQEIPWEMMKEEYVPLKSMFTFFIEPIYKGMPKIRRGGDGATHVGLVPFILAGFALARFRKKRVVISFVAAFAILFLILTCNPFYHLLWKYVPLFKSFRHLYRVMIGVVFVISVLAGFGTLSIIKKTEEKYKDNKKVWMAFSILLGVLLLNIVVFNVSSAYDIRNNVEEMIAKNHIMQNISSLPGIFRIQVYETRGIDYGTEFSQVPLGIQNIYGYETEWYPPYFNVYLGIANQQPAKFWGILNVKYMTSLNPVNVSGFKLLKELERCEDCVPEEDGNQKAFGRYLYENELFMPRAYIVENSILVVGSENAKLQTLYALMLDSNFNPETTVMIKGKESINDYSFEELSKHKAVFLTQGSIDQSSIFILKNYVENGGILLPDVVNGKTSITEEDISNMWESVKGSYTPIGDKEYITHNLDKYELKLDNKHTGFLVLSEKFSVFPGWSAKADGMEKEILSADSMITSVYIDKPAHSVIFEYRPRSYILGRNITIAAILAVVIYFAYYFTKNIGKNRVKSDKIEEN